MWEVRLSNIRLAFIFGTWILSSVFSPGNAFRLHASAKQIQWCGVQGLQTSGGMGAAIPSHCPSGLGEEELCFSFGL